MNKLRVFDAFSGIGGFRFGLKNSKLFHDSSSFVGYTDSDGLCRKVYSEIFNCPEEKCFNQIQDIHTTANPTNEYLPEFDLLLAGFPCQPFANIGHRRGFDDKRGTLIFRICELLEFYKPNYFILENVQKIRNIEKFTFNDVKFNAVSKNLYFDNLDSDTNTDINIVKKEIQKWFDSKIKIDGLEGDLSIKVQPIKIKKIKKDEYYRFEINLSMQFSETNKVLNSKKIYNVNSIEFGEIEGSFTIKDQENLNQNIIKKSLDSIGKKLNTIN